MSIELNGDTLKLIIFAESMAALAAKAIVDLRSVIQGSNSQTTAQILDDADATYQKIIAAAKE